MRNRLLAASLVAALAVATAPLSAKTFRWANDGDVIPFTADDVLFSFERARTSQIAATLATAKAIRKVDDFTVEIVTNGPDPIFPQEMTNWYMMSKVWAEKNKAEKMAEPTKSEDN